MVPHGVPSAISPSTRAKRWGGAVTAMVAFAVALGVLGSKGMLERRNKDVVKQPPTTATTEPMATSSLKHGLPQDVILSGDLDDQEEGMHVTTLATTAEAALSPAEVAFHPSNNNKDAVMGSNNNINSDGSSSSLLLDGGGAVCYVANGHELRLAVENGTCSTVLLTSTLPKAYHLDEEILVTRERVTITGTPSTMPTINAEDADRAFRVMPGAYLEVRYVTLVPSEAEGLYARRHLRQLRQQHRQQQQAAPAQGEEGPTKAAENNGTITIRGGCVLFESGAAGGLFVGVYFVDDPDPVAGVDVALAYTLEQTRVRVYGGFVYIADAEVDFISCLFWDLGILLPITDYVFIGGQILAVGGVVNMNGCTIMEFNVLGQEIGLGLNVAVLGGTLQISYMTYNEVNYAVSLIDVGDAFFVGDGLALYTGIDFNEWSALVQLCIAGTFTLVGGVQVMTGIANTEAVGLGDTFGVGAEYAVGLGVAINVGSVVTEFNAIYYQSTCGEVSFIGAGEYVSIGTPFIEYTAIIGENGLGGTFYQGAGHCVFVGASIVNMMAIANGWQTGGLNANSAGLFIWVGSVSVEASGMEFTKGLAGEIFVGAGGLVWTASESVELYTWLVGTHLDFWVNGACDVTDTDGNEDSPAWWDISVGCNNYELLDARFGASRRALAAKADSPSGDAITMTTTATTGKDKPVVVEQQHHHNAPRHLLPRVTGHHPNKQQQTPGAVAGGARHGQVGGDKEVVMTTTTTTTAAVAGSPPHHHHHHHQRQAAVTTPTTTRRAASDITTTGSSSISQREATAAAAQVEVAGIDPHLLDMDQVGVFFRGDVRRVQPSLEAIQDLPLPQAARAMLEPLVLEMMQLGTFHQQQQQQVQQQVEEQGAMTPAPTSDAAADGTVADGSTRRQQQARATKRQVSSTTTNAAAAASSPAAASLSSSPASTIASMLAAAVSEAAEAPIMHVAKAPQGSCNLFLPRDKVTGPGADACTFHDPATSSSDGDTITIPGLPPAIKNLPRLSPGEAIQFQPTILVVCTLKPTTRSGANLTLEALQESAAQATLEWQDHHWPQQQDQPTSSPGLQGESHGNDGSGTTGGDDGSRGHSTAGNDTIRVRVFSAVPSLPEAMLSAGLSLPPNRPRPSDFQTSEHDQSHHYKVVFVVSAQATADAIVAAVDETTTSTTSGDGGDGESWLAQAMKAHLEEKGVEVGHMGLAYEDTIVAPAYGSKAMLSNGNKGRRRLGGSLPPHHHGRNTVMVVDPDMPAVPVTHIECGKDYLVHLEQHTPGATLHVGLARTLLPAASDGDSGLESPSPPHPLFTLVADDSGMAQVVHRFDAAITPPDDYYLEVSTSDGEVGHSPPWLLVHQGQRPRKLYGASMVV